MSKKSRVEEVYLRHLRPKVRTKRAIMNMPVKASMEDMRWLTGWTGRRSP